MFDERLINKGIEMLQHHVGTNKMIDEGIVLKLKEIINDLKDKNQ